MARRAALALRGTGLRYRPIGPRSEQLARSANRRYREVAAANRAAAPHQGDESHESHDRAAGAYRAWSNALAAFLALYPD
jgi:hypothetical protein